MASSIRLEPAQQDAYEFAKDRDAAALYCEQRTGKTFVTMAILRYVAGSPINLCTGEGNNFCGLMVCLMANRESTWQDKLTEYLPWLNVTSDWDEFKKLPNPRMLLIHYEGLRKVIGKLVRYRKLNWMCVDESHKMGRRGSKQSRAIRRMSWVSRKLLLTGTPMEKNPSHLWAQFDFLVPGLLFDRWDDFEREYFEWREIENKQRPGTRAWRERFLQQRILRNKATFREEKRDQLVDLISPYSYRLVKEDVGIRRSTIEVVTVPITGSQRRHYDNMKSRSIIRLEAGQRVLAGFPAVNVIKQRQIASGFVYDDDGELHYLGDAKIDKLRSIFEEMRKPVVIFTAFIPDLKRIHHMLKKDGYRGEVVHGSIDKKKRPQIWRNFQKARYDYLVCQVRVGGAGNDLWKANNAIVHSLGHSFIDWDQLTSRLDVIGKEKSSRIVVLCGKNTIDEEVYDLVVVKRLNGSKVLNRLKKGVRDMAKTRKTKAAEAEVETEEKPKKGRKTAPTPPEPERHKYGVAELAEELGVQPASVRVALRKSSLERKGRSWGWDTDKEFKAAVKELKRETANA